MDYEQISCSLYDRLESLAITKKKVELKVVKETDTTLISGLIQNIFSEDKAEYLIINEQKIRLDKIASVKEL